MLDEQVEDVRLFALITEREGVVVPGIGTAGDQVEDRVVQFVGLTGVVFTDVDGVALTRTVDGNRVAVRDAELTEAVLADGVLTVHQVAVADADFRGEVVVPVRIQGGDETVQLGATLIEVVGEFELVRVTIRSGDVVAVIVQVDEVGAVLVVDLPVEADKQLVVFVRVGGRRHTRVVVVDVARDVEDFVVFSLRETSDFVDRTGTFDATREGVGTGQVLIVHEEEETVFDDRATDVEAVALFVEFRSIDAHAFEAVALQAVGGVVVEGTAVDLVTTGLGHRVDVTGRETAIVDIKRSQFDGDLREGVEREGLALGRETVRVQAETVIDADTVEGQRVEARVGAGALDAIDEGFVDIDARVGPDDVGDRAVDRRQTLEVGLGEDGGRADGDFNSVDRGRGHDDDVGRVGIEGQGQVGGGTQFDVDVFNALAGEARSRCGDDVGATRTQVVGREGAVGADIGRTHGAGRHVQHGHGTAGDGRTVRRGHGAGNGARGLLRVNRSRSRSQQGEGRRAVGKFFHE